MSKYIVKCRQCGQDVDLGKKIKAISIQCPSCGKTIVLPPHLRAKSKKGLILFILMLAVAVPGGNYLWQKYLDDKKLADDERKKQQTENHKKSEAERKKAGKERIALKMKIIDLCDEANLKTSQDFKDAFAAIQKYKSLCTDAEERESADEYRDLVLKAKYKALNGVYKRLGSEVAPLLRAGRFAECAKIYSDYDGPFSNETLTHRKSIAEKYKQQALANPNSGQSVDFDQPATLEQPAEENKQVQANKRDKSILSGIAKLLINKKFKTAYDEYQKNRDKESVAGLDKFFDDLIHIPSIVMNSFKDEKGKTVRIYLKSGPLSLEIVKVEGGILFAKYKNAKLVIAKKIKFSDLSAQEVAKRVARKNKEVANVYYGINLLSLQKYDDAEKHFQNSGALANPLVDELQTLRSEPQTSKSAVKVAASTTTVDPSNVPLEKIKIETAKVYTGTRKREVSSWGSNQRIQNILINLRNATGVPVSTGSIEFYVIGEGVRYKGTYQILYVVSKPLDMPRGGTMTIKDEFMNKYDDAGIKYGHTCYSWLLVIKDNKGKIKIVKAKHSKFEHAADKILGLVGKKIRKGQMGRNAPQFDDKGKVLNIDPGTPY